MVLCFLLAPLIFTGQSLTGLWSGSLSHDSTSVRKDQSFEIALTEYKGKVYGYSCSEFLVNDTLYYIVKRVKGTIQDSICEVTDDEIIAYNFRGRLDKGVKVTSTFRRNRNDSSWYLDGSWKTNATKKYYSVTGKVKLKEEKDLSLSKVFPHLEELNLADEIAFYRDRTSLPVIAKLAKPEKINSEFNESKNLDTRVDINPVAPDLQQANADATLQASVQADMIVAKIKKPENNFDKTENIKIIEQDKNAPVISKPELKQSKPDASVIDAAQVDASIAAIQKPEIKNTKTTTQPINSIAATNPAVAANPAKPAKQNIAVNKPVAAVTKPVSTNNNATAATSTHKPIDQPVAKTNTVAVEKNKPASVSSVVNPVPAVVEQKEEKNIAAVKTDAEVAASGAVIANRKSEFAQVVHYKSDSLVLALYDNGEIDGDTVSVFLNGTPLMVKQGLKAYAIKKTIYVDKSSEDFNLVLFADNLGKYPPNTGLLVVKDGEDTYQIRFSSDLQKSSGVVFRKKK